MFLSRFSKNAKKRRAAHDLEPQEVFLDKLAHQQEERLGSAERKFEVPLSRVLLRGFVGVVLLVVCIFVGKTAHMQLFLRKDFVAAAEENNFLVRQIHATRGVIYDAAGTQLVFNIPRFDVLLTFSELPPDTTEQTRVIHEIATLTAHDAAALTVALDEARAAGAETVMIAKDIDHETLLLFETRQTDLPGVSIGHYALREYHEGPLFAHVLGYTGGITKDELAADPAAYTLSDSVGRTGLEKSYETILRKKPGALQFERDAVGNVLSRQIVQLPASGESIGLWLDAALQKKVDTALRAQLASMGTTTASAIALDSNTGGVLALVTIPSFDNNVFSVADEEALTALLTDPAEPLFNRALAGLYATGSTIKPLLATAALQENIISPNKNIFGGPYIEIEHRYDPDIIYRFHDWKTHGWVDMRRAIAVSSNVYFYTIGGGYEDQQGLGPSRIKQYLEQYNWGQATGIDLPGESVGLIPSPAWKQEHKGEGWWDGDTYNLSIGQGNLLITPIQIATSFAAIANGGTLYAPQVVKEVISSTDHRVLHTFQPYVIRESFIDPDHLRIAREGMRQAVTDGYSTILNEVPVKVAAKTGTAQTPRDEIYDNWVTVFAPYENPEIVLTILLEDVQGLQSGLPVAKEILEWYFNRTPDL